MTHDVLATGPLQCNCQILGDEESKTALVVDPGDDIPEIEQLLERRGLTVAKILFTHAHFDHIGRAAQLKRSSGAPTWLHKLEIPVLKSLDQQAVWIGVEPGEPVEIDHYYDEGDVVEFAGHEFQVLFTPGHSPGSVSFYIPSLERLIAGDVLFRDSIGRKYISSTLPDTYMQINDEDLPMLTQATTLNNNYALEARGIWEVINDYMGGAFVSYLIHNPDKNELLFVDGFIHAPGEDKRDFMQYLEYVLRTTKF